MNAFWLLNAEIFNPVEQLGGFGKSDGLNRRHPLDRLRQGTLCSSYNRTYRSLEDWVMNVEEKLNHEEIEKLLSIAWNIWA